MFVDFFADLFQIAQCRSVGGFGGGDLVLELLDATLLGFQLFLAQLLLFEVGFGLVDVAPLAFF